MNTAARTVAFFMVRRECKREWKQCPAFFVSSRRLDPLGCLRRHAAKEIISILPTQAPALCIQQHFDIIYLVYSIHTRVYNRS